MICTVFNFKFKALNEEAKGNVLLGSLTGALLYESNIYPMPDEFSIIKSHPVTGAKIASQHQSTKDYVDVIRGHHVWYDCTNGYPKNFNTFESPYKTIIDIVSIADSIDAATDAVGRSYSKKISNIFLMRAENAYTARHIYVCNNKKRMHAERK